MIQLICQWLIIASLAFNFIAMVYSDFHGSKAKEPSGFEGFIWSMVVTAFALIIWAGAGLFDRILWSM